jgi:methionyl-tRNA formyltransferase
MKKVVFAGTPEFAAKALEAIVAAGYPVVMCLTQPDRPAGRGMHLQASPVKRLAQDLNIPVLQPTSLKVNGKYSEEAQAALAQLQSIEFDVMIVAAYGLLLPQEVFDIATRDGRAGCINIHASLLPRWRGAAPIQRAIEAGDTETGIAIMQMDLGLDTGPVICQESLSIGADETALDLHDRLAEQGARLIVQVLHRLNEEGAVSAIPQAELGVTYAAKIQKDEAQIEWALNAKVLHKKISAFNPFPGAVAYLDEEKTSFIKVWRSSLADPQKQNSDPGTILEINDQGVLLQTGEGCLYLKELQKPGGKRQDASTFALQQSWWVGQRLF